MPDILVVDDHDDVRAVVRAALEAGPYEVHEAANGAEGLHCARDVRPDVVVLDVTMPGELDGYAVCSALKSDPKTQHARVVMLTARCRVHELHLGRLGGCDAYVMKPFSPEHLLRTVRSLLKRRSYE